MSTEPCRCNAHSQHVVFQCLVRNPGISLKAAAKQLGMSHVAVRIAKHRLKQRNTSLLCPECFRPGLQGLTCSACGAELMRLWSSQRSSILNRPSIPFNLLAAWGV
jgi:hypothetical protein